MFRDKKICVCGAGTMGSGIAQVAAQHGFAAIQFDTNKTMLDKSKATVTKSLQALADKKKISNAEQDIILNRIFFTDKIEDCIAGIFIEAIIEKPEAKIALLHQLSAINKPEAIFATNTSSISVSAIAASVTNPSQIVGMHFFNPAQIMKLVEIIKGDQTSETVVRAVFQLAKDFGKTPVLCKDKPGFIVNRVARQYYLEAMQLVDSGLATVEDIDAIMQESGFKMGPFALMDLIGIDINYAVSNIVWNDLGKPLRLMPSDLQKQKIGAGDLGRKTMKGFYNYTQTNG